MYQGSYMDRTLTYTVATYRWHQRDTFLPSGGELVCILFFPWIIAHMTPYTAGSPQLEPLSPEPIPIIFFFCDAFCGENLIIFAHLLKQTTDLKLYKKTSHRKKYMQEQYRQIDAFGRGPAQFWNNSEVSENDTMT